MEQELNGEDYATFYSIIGSAEEGMIVRSKVKSENILNINKGKVNINGGVEDKLVWPAEPLRKPKVQTWLDEVKKIMTSKELGQTRLFRDYFK